MRSAIILWQYFLCFLRILLFPVSYYLLPLVSRLAQERKSFELRNLTDPYAKSFDCSAAVAFEVSSEGELEQVRPLLDHFLGQGRLVELIYASASVDKKCQVLAHQYPNQLRLFRLPILSFGRQTLFSWITAPQLFLCRYDFYPELLIIGASRKAGFYLLSASLKGKNLNCWWRRWCWRKIFRLFDRIICASNADQQRFELLIDKAKLMTFDFRIVQIANRLFQAEKKLGNLPPIEMYKRYLDYFPRYRRLILGSAWVSELELLNDSRCRQMVEEKKLQITIAPHVLAESSLEQLIKQLQQSFTVYHISSKLSQEQVAQLFSEMALAPGIIVISIPGILCELYGIFGHAFVGGGHGRSIHSVLEPYLAACQIYCGPKVHRSTEYDFIIERSSNEIHIVKELEQFFEILLGNLDVTVDDIGRKNLIGEYYKEYGQIIDLIGTGHAE